VVEGEGELVELAVLLAVKVGVVVPKVVGVAERVGVLSGGRGTTGFLVPGQPARKTEPIRARSKKDVFRVKRARADMIHLTRRYMKNGTRLQDHRLA